MALQSKKFAILQTLYFVIILSDSLNEQISDVVHKCACITSQKYDFVFLSYYKSNCHTLSVII